MTPSFSSRTRWDLRPNRLSAAIEARRRAGHPILDLTESNPTRCGLSADDDAILRALSRPEALRYDPDPSGLPSARRAVSNLYAAKGVSVVIDRIVLTSSTSEAYGHLFRLLCDPGDAVLVPAPSYPLFDLLGRINDVELIAYPLIEDEGFRIDLHALEAALTSRSRAILVVNPGNPTGAFLRADDHEGLVALCDYRGLALVSDEVFSSFPAGSISERVATIASEDRVLCFALNGISKMLAMPQMKLGWIVAFGPGDIVKEALGRLEMIADTYLSVNTPVQAALPDLLALQPAVNAKIRARLASNRRTLDSLLTPPHPAGALPSEGGWSAVIRVPSTRSDEAWALALLEEDGVLVHPGYFYDFQSEGHLVVSLLPEERVFSEAASRMAGRINA